MDDRSGNAVSRQGSAERVDRVWCLDRELNPAASQRSLDRLPAECARYGGAIDLESQFPMERVSEYILGQDPVVALAGTVDQWPR